MKESYLKYYESYSARAPLAFLWDSIRAPSRIAKRSLTNRQQDYTRLAQDPELLALHLELNRLLYESVQEWDSYDYGEGYFYQVCDLIGVTGLVSVLSIIPYFGALKEAGRQTAPSTD